MHFRSSKVSSARLKLVTNQNGLRFFVIGFLN